MRHWLRILLTGMASVFGGYSGLMTIGGTAAGIAWIYLWGDGVWPKWSEPAILGAALAGALGGSILSGLAAWRATGKKWD